MQGPLNFEGEDSSAGRPGPGPPSSTMSARKGDCSRSTNCSRRHAGPVWDLQTQGQSTDWGREGENLIHSAFNPGRREPPSLPPWK